MSVGRSFGRFVGLLVSVCPHVFSHTVAVVDTKRGGCGYVLQALGTQQESGAALSKNSMFTASRHTHERSARV